MSYRKIASSCQRPVKISRNNREVTDNANQSTANYGKCGSSVALRPQIRSRCDHEIATDALNRRHALARNDDREEDRRLKK
jgi:hypothetical protein